MKSQECIENLVAQLLPLMDKKQWSIADLSARCDMSYHAMYNIISHKTEDMLLSTLLRILEGTDISVLLVFGIPERSETAEKEMLQLFLLVEQCYYILKKYSKAA